MVGHTHLSSGVVPAPRRFVRWQVRVGVWTPACRWMSSVSRQRGWMFRRVLAVYTTSWLVRNVAFAVWLDTYRWFMFVSSPRSCTYEPHQYEDCATFSHRWCHFVYTDTDVSPSNCSPEPIPAGMKSSISPSQSGSLSFTCISLYSPFHSSA